MNWNRVARVAIPLATLLGLAWSLGGREMVWTVLPFVAVALAGALALVGYYKRTLPHAGDWSAQETFEALASLCSPAAIRRCDSAWQALACAALLAVFLPTVLLMPVLLRLTRKSD